LELQPPVVVRTHASGAVYAYPLGDPTLVCRADDEEQALATLSLFLTEHLAKLSADALSSFAFPEAAVLHDIPMVIARDDLDRRFGVDGPIAVPCVAVPFDDAWWVHVLPLRHAIYVAPGEDLVRRVIDETTRHLAAHELGPTQWASLLPAQTHALRRLQISVARNDHDDLGKRAESRRTREGNKSRAAALELLGQVGTDALANAKTSATPAAIARTTEINRLAALLGGEERVSVALVGPSLAGKTAVLEALLSQAVVPFRAHPVYATSGAALVAGQSGFGELAERVHDVMQAASRVDAILYFDNLADLFAGKSGGIEDLASALRPWIVDGRVRVVGECTAEAFEQFEKQQPTLLACMHRVGIEPLSADTTRKIITDRAAHSRRREPDRPTLAERAAAPLVELCERYLVDAAFPGKAVRLFEELRAIHRHDVDDTGKPRVIDVHDVYRAFSLRTGMPMFLLREDEKLRRDTLAEEFQRRVIGQREAIGSVIETLCTVKARLQPPGKPLANFLFVGPTGVGKTEVAKTLARILFGSPDRMVRFDMSEYTDPFAAERLIRGTATDDGELTRRIRQQPFSVLLLDEIEKAHPAVFDLLLQVLGEGRLTDARGRTTHFGNAIIIMTSNLGASHRSTGGGGPGFGSAQHDDAASDALTERRHYVEQVDRHFRPEFVNRIDRIIPFASLGRDEIGQVARVSLRRIRERGAFAQRGLELAIDDETLAVLANRGYSKVYGARALRRQLEDHLVAPIAGVLSGAGPLPEGSTIDVAIGDDAITRVLAAADATAESITAHGDLRIALVRRGAGSSRSAGPASVSLYSRMRRNAAAAMQCPRIEELAKRAAYLTADIASQSTAQTSYARSEVVGSLREHQRITQALARVNDAMAALEAVEELAMASDGDGNEVLYAEASLAHATFEHAFVGALFETEPRDATTVMVTAPAGLAPLDRWLGWFAAWAEARKWSYVLHREADTSPEWPAALPWGPPRELAIIRKDTASATQAWRSIIVRVSGPASGWLLALEAGLHRMWPADRASADHLWVHVVSPKFQVGEAELLSKPFAPPPREASDQLHRMTAVREVFDDGTINMLGQRLATIPGVDLTKPGVLERLWFRELVRRANDNVDLATGADD
jgi:ATP-dependent Clp protease ATP-binding subunit ClpC